MGINFMDLRSQYDQLGDVIKEKINAVLEHGRYCMGPEVMELEQALADYSGAKHVLGCSSGTDALLMPLMAYEVGPGDAVFTSPFTFFATAEAIAILGATPIFVDVDPHTYNIDPAKLETAIANVKAEGKLNAKGIIPVDIFGIAADYDAINPIAEREGLFVIEDAAQSIGGSYKGRKNGSLATVAATSFYPAKPLGCYGDGGAVFTNDDRIKDLMHSIRVHGQSSDKYNNVRLGLNARLDSIQAAVVLAKLPTLDEEIANRNRVAVAYNNGIEGVQLPIPPEGIESAWAIYTVLSDERDALQKHLGENGVPSGIYYGRCLHLQDAFKNLGHKKGDLPIAESLSDRCLSLPMHPFLKDEEIETVIKAVNSFGK